MDSSEGMIKIDKAEPKQRFPWILPPGAYITHNVTCDWVTSLEAYIWNDIVSLI